MASRDPWGQWRDAGELLADRRFRRFFLGCATSLIGSSMAPPAMTLAVLADRVPRRAVMVGADLAGVLLLRVHIRRTLLVIAFIQPAWVGLLVPLALRAPLPLVVAAAFAVGFSASAFNALWRTTEQRLVPQAVLSRVSACELLGAYALGPVGLAMVGPVSEIVGTASLLLAAAGWQVFSSAMILLLPEVRSIRPERAS